MRLRRNKHAIYIPMRRMKWIEAKIEILSGHVDQMTDVISDVFFGLGLTGVVIEDPNLAPADGWAEDAPVRAECHAVTGFLPLNDSGRECLARLQQHQLRAGASITASTSS